MNDERHKVIKELETLTEEHKELNSLYDRACKRIEKQDERIDSLVYQVKTLEGDIERMRESHKAEKQLNEKLFKDLEDKITKLKMDVKLAEGDTQAWTTKF